MGCKGRRWGQQAARLPVLQVSMLCVDIERCTAGVPYHARAGQRVPTEANAICVLNLAPLVLERLEVCHSRSCLRGGGGGVWAMSRGGERGRPQFDSEGLAVRKRGDGRFRR